MKFVFQRAQGVLSAPEGAACPSTAHPKHTCKYKTCIHTCRTFRGGMDWCYGDFYGISLLRKSKEATPLEGFKQSGAV